MEKKEALERMKAHKVNVDKMAEIANGCESVFDGMLDDLAEAWNGKYKTTEFTDIACGRK